MVKILCIVMVSILFAWPAEPRADTGEQIAAGLTTTGSAVMFGVNLHRIIGGTPTKEAAVGGLVVGAASCGLGAAMVINGGSNMDDLLGWTSLAMGALCLVPSFIALREARPEMETGQLRVGVLTPITGPPQGRFWGLELRRDL